MSLPTGEQLRHEGMPALRDFYNLPEGLNRLVTGEAIEYTEEPFFIRVTDRGWFDWVTRYMQGVPLSQIIAEIKAIPGGEYQQQQHPPAPGPMPGPFEPLQRLHVDGPIFRTADGKPWRYKAVSAFKLPQRWERGEDVSAFVGWARDIGANTFRVFLQHKFLDYPAIDPYIMPIEKVRPFVDWCASQGFYVELTVLCDTQKRNNGDDVDGFDQSTDECVRRMNQVFDVIKDAPNVFVEYMNEPEFNGGIERLAEITRRTVLARSRYLCASGLAPVTGSESPESLLLLDYVTDHPPRKLEWPDECGKIGYYVYKQTGRPHLHDEPIRHGEDARDGQETNPQQDEDAGFGIAIRSAGGTFHSNNGVQTVVPGPIQDACARAFFEAMDAVPADAPTGRYSHDGLDDHPLQPTTLAGEVADSIMPNGTIYTAASRVQPGWEPVVKSSRVPVSRMGTRGQFIVTRPR